MSFDVYGASQKESGDKPKIDFNEMNTHVVETANLQERETLVGYISMIVDLGEQEQADAEVVFAGSEEDERKAVAEYPNTYFKNGVDDKGNPVRLKCWPQKPVQCVALAVDFPEIIVDKGQFFGESNPLPLRLWLGNQFWIEGDGFVVAQPAKLRVNKALGDWSLDVKNVLYKMAVGAKLIKQGEVFHPKRLDELLGKAFQFEAQVFFKENKGKKYYTEYVKYAAPLGRGQSQPELLTTPLIVQFNKDNDQKAVNDLRNHIVNTLKRAKNYEGSKIKQQIESIKSVEEKQHEEKAAITEEDDFDDSIPF